MFKTQRTAFTAKPKKEHIYNPQNIKKLRYQEGAWWEYRYSIKS